jgi:hypothetical protein
MLPSVLDIDWETRRVYLTEPILEFFLRMTSGAGVADPEELAWFKDKVHALNLSGGLSKYMYIDQGEYKGMLRKPLA